MCERMNEKQIFLKILRILSGSHLLFVQLIVDDKKRNFGEFDAQQALYLKIGRGVSGYDNRSGIKERVRGHLLTDRRKYDDKNSINA